MTIQLTKEDAKIVKQCHTYVDEVYVDNRKGVAQTFYVIQVKPDATYYCQKTDKTLPTPVHLVGYWRQRFATDNRYDGITSQLDDTGWVKCNPVPKVVTVLEWEVL